MDAIVDNLRHLQALAINAATDTNTDDDRATIQKEIVQRLDEINDIASHTNFNGKYLLNGDYGKRTVYNTQTVTTSGVITTYTTVDTEAEIISTTTIDTQTEIISTTTVNTTTEVSTTTIVSTTTTVNTTTQVETTTVISNTDIITTTTVNGVAEPTGTAVALSAGNTTITQDGVYDLAGYSGTLTISADNVKLTNSAGGTLNEVYIEDSGLQKLWLDGINITNTQAKSAIAFSGSDNVLCLCKGSTNTIKMDNGFTIFALINAGAGLTITGYGSLNVQSYVNNGDTGALIGSDQRGTCGSITIDSGVTLTAAANINTGAAIGSGWDGSCGEIIICSGANVTAGGGYGVIGSGSYGTCTNIAICSGATVKAQSTMTGSGGITVGYAAAIGSGQDGNCGDVTIYSGANIDVYSPSGAGVGSGQYGTSEDILIYSGATVKSAGNARTPRIGVNNLGNRATCTSVTYPSGMNLIVSANSTSTTTATSYFYGYSGNKSTISELTNTQIVSTETVSTTTTVNTTTTVSTTTTVNTTTFVNTTTVVTSTVTVPTTTTITETVIVPTTTTIAETSTGQVTSTIVTTSTVISNAYFQWGARSNQSTALNINDMHTKSLRGEVPSRSDTERLNAMDSDSAEYASFTATLKAASNLTLDDISVGTRENANVAICVINGALEYALDVSTTLGAHSRRMEFAAYNVTTMAENVQASESVIRDTDMAKAMTGYTKANVLRQAAQSMLAQANQNGSNVISLLRQ